MMDTISQTSAREAAGLAMDEAHDAVVANETALRDLRHVLESCLTELIKGHLLMHAIYRWPVSCPDGYVRDVHVRLRRLRRARSRLAERIAQRETDHRALGDAWMESQLAYQRESR
jgi:hypothetical protein